MTRLLRFDPVRTDLDPQPRQSLESLLPEKCLRFHPQSHRFPEVRHHLEKRPHLDPRYLKRQCSIDPPLQGYRSPLPDHPDCQQAELRRLNHRLEAHRFHFHLYRLQAPLHPYPVFQYCR